MLRQFELVERLKSYDPHADEELLNRAYVFSVKAHGSQLRASGDPYFSHPIEVAGILTELKLDSQSIITALLHDVVEDTVATLEDIESLFGPQIAQLVNGITKLSKIELQSEASKQAENFRKLVLAMSSDIRVLLVKLADRLHNMRTLKYIKSEEKRRRIAHETLEIYAPLAERMGILRIKNELEDLSFLHLQPDIYQSIKSRLSFIYTSSQSIITEIIENIKDLTQKFGLETQVSGRVKMPYSIWRKMQNKNITLEQLSDIMAFRIVVKSVPECYQALGIIHTHYSVVPGCFKDYISTPKPNQYQSIHSTLIGPLNQRIEVQIRTDEMHNICENGVAAHWQYKHPVQDQNTKQYAWLRGLLEILEHASSPDEFLEHTKLEMFQDQVFCFTPKGELINLPKGATPVDFAYAIHSQIGDRTVGAKVNGRQVPLRTVLQNGDQVDIITSQVPIPSPTWERFVVSGKARARVKKFIKNQQRQQFCELGKSLLQRKCLKEKIDFDEAVLMNVLNQFQYKTLSDLYASIGEGIHTSKEILLAAYPEKITHLKKKQQKPNQDQVIDHSLSIKGLIPGMALHFANCCHPLPGDKIVGFVTVGKGITIHTHDCEVVSSDYDRILELSWQENHINKPYHIGRLKVMFMNKPGSLANMTGVISKQGGNIVNLKIINRTPEFWDLLVDIEVKNVEHLKTIMAALRVVYPIQSVERI